MTLKLKGCPRCGGDCVKEEEEYEKVWLCIQCGFREPVKEAKK